MMSSDSEDTYRPVSCFSSFNIFIILYHHEEQHNFPTFMACSGQYTQASEEEGPHQCSILCILSIKMSSPGVLNPSIWRDQEA